MSSGFIILERRQISPKLTQRLAPSRGIKGEFFILGVNHLFNLLLIWLNSGNRHVVYLLIIWPCVCIDSIDRFFVFQLHPHHNSRHKKIQSLSILIKMFSLLWPGAL